MFRCFVCFGDVLLKHICKGIADWLDRAGESERELSLDAIQVTVEATENEATVSGVLALLLHNL